MTNKEIFLEQMFANKWLNELTDNEVEHLLDMLATSRGFGYSACQKEYEEKQKWIKVKNDYFKQGLEEDILIKFKSSLNREVIVVGHIFQGRFYMNYSNDARPLKNVMSFRYFL